MQIALRNILARGRFCFLLLVAYLLCGAFPARADLQFDVFLGYDGTVREASWFPIVCEIRNGDAPFTGVIEVSPAGYGKGQSERMVVELPTGTLKRVVIPAFANSRYQTLWDVRLLDDRGRVRQEQVAVRPQRQIGWEVKLVGSLPRTASGSATLVPIKRNQPDMQPAAVRFQPSIFPDNPLVLEGLDALYLHSEVAASLRSSQVNAILAWMNAGGHLIVAIEQVSDITASPWLRNVLPFEPKEVVPVSQHPELENWVRTGVAVTNYPPGYNRRPRQPGGRVPSLPPTTLVETPFSDLPADSAFGAAEIRVVSGNIRDGRTVLAAGEIPLIITANRGLGRVTALLFSPEREPFKSWRNLPTFWTKLVEVPGALYANTDFNAGYGHSADGIFGAMIDSRQVHKLPVGWLLLLLLVYLLVIGPFDRFWLKRINRPMLTWITFPCYVVFFSGLIYFIGYRLRAGDSEYNEIHLVDVLRNGERAELRGRTYASIYSPANAAYAMRSELKYSTFRGEFQAMGGGQNLSKADILLTGDNFKAEVFVPVWTSQLYVNDWWHSGTMPFVVSLKPSPDGWSVLVSNQSGKAVADARLVVNGAIFPVGNIAAGQNKALQLPNTNGVPLEQFVQEHGAGYEGAVQERQYAFGRKSGGRIEDLPTASMVASFIGELPASQGMNFVAPPGLDLSKAVTQGHAVLLAWSPGASPAPPLNQFKSKRSASNTLWRIPVAITQD
ncbi:MAG: hypothetical protein U1F83_13795 [Verrucomicrobiota bacterium]